MEFRCPDQENPNQYAETKRELDIKQAMFLMMLKAMHRVVSSHQKLPTGNSMASSPLAIRQRWQQSFAEKLGGHLMKITDMHLAMVEREEKQFDTEMLKSIPIEYVPTIEQLSAMISRAKPRKAHGEDGIPVEVYAAVADTFGTYALSLVVQNDVQPPGTNELERRNAHGAAQSERRPERLQCVSWHYN